MRVGLLAALLVAVALAGCSEDAAVIDDKDETFDGIDAEATDETGIIRGVVVDTAINPIPGVTITVISTELTATTNENGAFAFEGLDPGAYFLEATKDGFETIQGQANVVANVNDPPVVKIQMVADPSTLPFVQDMVYDAYIQCSETVILVGYSGGCQNDFMTQYGSAELSRIPDFAQTEMVWESTQPLGDWMSVLYSSPPIDGNVLLHNFVEAEGPSSLVLKANRTLLEHYTVGLGTPNNNCDSTLCIRVFNTGIEGTDIGRDYGDPVDGDDCVDRPALGQCMHGVGATIDQRLTVFTHVFFNAEPEEDWLFSTDGSP